MGGCSNSLCQFSRCSPLPCLATSQDPLPGIFRLHRPAPGPCWRIKKWWTILIIPIGSMVLEYLPTFGSYMGQMLVNIPYMEHMGLFESSKRWRIFNILVPNNRGIAVPKTQKTATFHPILHPILVSAPALKSPRASPSTSCGLTRPLPSTQVPLVLPKSRLDVAAWHLVPLFLFPEHGWILLVSFVSLDYMV